MGLLGYNVAEIERLIERLYTAQESTRNRANQEAVQEAIDILDGLLVEGHI